MRANEFISEKWSQKYKRSINCNNPKGFSQKAHCAGRKKHNEDIEQVEENLHKWFKEKWVRFGPDGKIRGACARGDDSEGKPKCLPQAKAHALGKKGRKYAAAKKRREDPNPERRGPAKNVATKKKTDEAQLDEFELPSLTQLLNPSQQQAPGADKPVEIVVYGKMGPPRGIMATEVWDALMEILPEEYPTLESAKEKVAEIAQYGGATVAQRPMSQAQKIVKQFQTYGIKAKIETSEGVAEASNWKKQAAIAIAKKNKLKEFSQAPKGDDGEDPDEGELRILHTLASLWWNGTEQEMIRAERTLAAMGWEIGQDDGYDQGGVFLIRAGDEHGRSFISWPHEDLYLQDN